MRKLFFTIVLMIGFTAMAQTGHRKGMKDWSPEKIASLQTKQMTLALDLTDAQQTQIQKMNLENATSRMERIKEMKAKKENGEGKTFTSEERYAYKAARLDHQIAQKEQLQKILSKEQLEKWENKKKERMSHREGKGKGSHRAKTHKQ
ncbi:hypothetical protein KCTC52924_01898 [Arenibacter antarcticus]|uniref:LTXXQ motif family protein n=1 Tax=Arenibacter antarcticus TaxID=2040469 RepID=A0ABW5VIW1_9FLAO|nr:hypothetical protein [Arenibacter sp. H213]MCM4167041.1 hypothetical protein [Arenibacter sp. H213]